MTVNSLSHQTPASTPEKGSRPQPTGHHLVEGLEEFIHRPCGMTVRPDHTSCPHCDAVLKPATQEIKVAPIAPVRRTALGSAPNNTPAPTTREGTNYLKNNPNKPIPTTNKSVTDIH